MEKDSRERLLSSLVFPINLLRNIIVIMAEVKNRRVTMTKHIVGKVKTSTYALPDTDFVYGIESKLDNEGAGAG